MHINEFARVDVSSGLATCWMLRSQRTTRRSSEAPDLDVGLALTVRSDPGYLSLIRGITGDVCESLGINLDAAYGVKLAVGEAVSNAMEHGSANGKADSVQIIFAKSEESLRVDVIDTGPGMCFPVNLRRCRRRNRGFGLRLMRNLMDTVDYLRVERGTRLVMTKRLRS